MRHRDTSTFLLGATKGIYYNKSYNGGEMKLKLRAVGTSTGLVFPKESLNRLNVKRGDTLFLVETADGFLITPYDPELEKQLELGREILRDHRDTLRALAK
jgi:putative addiction module antidote